MKHSKQYGVELSVMGTTFRAGISGFSTGKTAERLLAHIPRSTVEGRQ
jgi:hypothetical protein